MKCKQCQDTYHGECFSPLYPTKLSRKKKIWVSILFIRKYLCTYVICNQLLFIFIETVNFSLTCFIFQYLFYLAGLYLNLLDEVDWGMREISIQTLLYISLSEINCSLFMMSKYCLWKQISHKFHFYSYIVLLFAFLL